MIRTQIQLPDEVFAKAKKLCEAREISFAELARRGIEYILSVYSQNPENVEKWELPKPRNLSWKGLSHAETAAAMKISRSSVEKHIMTSLKHILARVGR